jgi:hypothetical protein
MIPFRKILWAMLQVALFLVGMLAFFVWAPWLGAVSIGQAPASVIASLPANCPAVEVNHGVYSCFWQGTVASNPLGFGICSTIFFGSVGFALYIAISGRGVSRK